MEARFIGAKSFVLALAAVATLGMGAAWAYDTCAPCARSVPVRPVYRPAPVVVRSYSSPTYYSTPTYTSVSPAVRTRVVYEPMYYNPIPVVSCDPCAPVVPVVSCDPCGTAAVGGVYPAVTGTRVPR